MNKWTANIPTDNVTVLNEQIYAGAKLASDKIGVPRRNQSRNRKAGGEIKREGQVKKLRQQAKMLRKEKTRGYVELKRPKQKSRQI